MDHLKNIRLSRWGATLLAVVSLAATIVILAGGGDKSNVVLAAQAALAHRPHMVEVVEPPAQTVTVATPAVTVTPPASDSSGSTSSGNTGSGDTGSGNSGSTSSPTGNSSSASQTTTTPATTTTTAASPDAGLPKVGHIFLLTLSTTDYRSAFGAKSAAPYLRSLLTRGTVLSGYHALGKQGLVDLLAMLGGQPPNRDTSAGCTTYTPFPQSATLNGAGVVKGAGCVYPDAALSLADQVNAAGKSWGAYIDGMGPTNCTMPSTGAALDTPLDGTTAGYDVAHNPFGFFGSLLDAGGCSEYDQDLSNLPKALAKKSATPAFTYLAGNACVDAAPTLAPAATATTTTTPASTVTGADGTVTTTPGTVTTTPAGVTTTSTLPARLIPPAAYGCPAGAPSGIAAEDTFLKTWVPKILSSGAYRTNGVLVIALTGAGGKATADTGALVLSRWTPKARRITTAYTAYSLLHSVEDMLNLAPLAKAAAAPAFAQLVLR